MPSRKHGRGRLIPAFVACFYAGVLAGWLLRDADQIGIARDQPENEATETQRPQPETERPLPAIERDAGGGIVPGLPAQGLTPRSRPLDGADSGVVATTGPARSADPAIRADPVAELRRHHLRLPIDDAKVSAM